MGKQKKSERNGGKEKVCKLFQPSKLEVFIGSKAPGLTQRHAHTDSHTHSEPPVVFTAGLTAVIC